MSTTTRAGQSDRSSLPADTCLARLARSRAGYLSCSTRAMPTVVPVTVRVVSGELLVDLPDAQLAEQIMGQVVALGVGRPRRAWRSGWSVVARGPVSEVPGRPRSLVLDPHHLEGRALARTDRS